VVAGQEGCSSLCPGGCQLHISYGHFGAAGYVLHCPEHYALAHEGLHCIGLAAVVQHSLGSVAVEDLIDEIVIDESAEEAVAEGECCNRDLADILRKSGVSVELQVDCRRTETMQRMRMWESKKATADDTGCCLPAFPETARFSMARETKSAQNRGGGAQEAALMFEDAVQVPQSRLDSLQAGDWLGKDDKCRQYGN